MLMPDVTAILDDPELGGGVVFQVKRTTNTRIRGGVTSEDQMFTATGNIQPQTKNIQPSTAEDLLNESIVIRSTFVFQKGHTDGSSFVGADVVIYDGASWRVTQIENWKDWGFTTAYASKMRG